MTIAQCLLDAQRIYDTNVKSCREEMVRADASARKRKRRKSPKRKSPKRRSPKRKSRKRKSRKRKSPKRKSSKRKSPHLWEGASKGRPAPWASKRKKKSRKGPFESATLFPVGYRLWGNDGKRWEVMSDKNGRKRWKRVSTDTL